jgi:tetraacyldisaccharide 4'-kinase
MIFKKPKFWDLKKLNLISFFLLPLTLIIIINNYFLKFKPKKNQDIKTICVGNIYLGGTGKTPTSIKLYEIIKKFNPNVSTAKKFYPSQVDENIILQKNTKLISAKNRKIIIEQAIKDQQDIVIFDDGLQDRSVSYDIEFVCFDSINFIGNGQLIPAGPLREKLNSLNKYDGIFLKGDNKISNDQLTLIKKNNPDIKIFETYFEITNLDKFNLTDNFLIFSGIGNPASFSENLIQSKFNIKKEIIFPDHYNYKKREIKNIIKLAKDINAKIITTEKDFVKISKFGFNNIDFIEIKLRIRNEESLKEFLKTRLYE